MKRNKYMADTPIVGRTCGECTACCVLPRIADRPGLTSLPLLPEGKPGYTPCQHLNGSGCARYDERPPVCTEFHCLWHFGLIAGDERRRPDNLGIMFTLEEHDDGGYVIEAWELWEGAALEYPGRGAIDAIQEATGKVMVRYYGVPCSIHLRVMSVSDGMRLSMAARNDPKGLARWLRQQVEKRFMQDNPDKAAQLDVESLERGEPVVAHFKPKG